MARKFYFGIAVLLCVSIVSHAAVVITDDGNPRLRSTYNTQVSGYDFTVGDTPIIVSALGVWDDDATDVESANDGPTGGTPDGLAGGVTLRLFEQTSATTGTLLDQVTISAGIDPDSYLIGEFRYEALATPITLSAALAV